MKLTVPNHLQSRKHYFKGNLRVLLIFAFCFSSFTICPPFLRQVLRHHRQRQLVRCNLEGMNDVSSSGFWHLLGKLCTNAVRITVGLQTQPQAVSYLEKGNKTTVSAAPVGDTLFWVPTIGGRIVSASGGHPTVWQRLLSSARQS